MNKTLIGIVFIFMYSNLNATVVNALTKQCDNGKPKACTSLGVLYEDGDTVAKDEVKATQLYEKSCNMGYPNGCNNLGLMYEDGRGVEQNNLKASELYQKSCNAGNAWGCGNLAYLSSQERGININQSKAIELYKVACTDKMKIACESLGRIYTFGNGTIANKAKAKKYFKLACNQGSTDSCNSLKELNSEDKTSYKNFKLQTVTGKTINIFETYDDRLKVHEFEGKDVLLFFFGNVMYSKLDGKKEHVSSFDLERTDVYTDLMLFETKESKDLKIIGIEAQAYPASKLKKFVNDYGMKKNIIAGVDYLSFMQYISDMSGFKTFLSIPLLIAINKQGEVKYIHGYTIGGNIEGVSYVLEKKDVDYILENLNK